MTTTLDPFVWSGKHTFRVSGSDLHEDTLKIRSHYGDKERLLTLILPTLCITYADMKFQNAVGGQQEPFPASSAYGPVHFSPSIDLTGRETIERLTYIRGAERVLIGPHETEIHFRAWADLVIPRLRIARKKPAEAVLVVPETRIERDLPLRISVLQFADGRHVGGVRVEKRHPEWKPKSKEGEYDLGIKVIDGEKRQPIPEAQIEIWQWNDKLKTPTGMGGFTLDGTIWTDGDGWAEAPARPAGALEAYVLRLAGYRAVVRCLRPLPGQRVRLHMMAWPLTPANLRYEWKASDRLEFIAALADMTPERFLRANGIADARRLHAGMRVLLPCYLARYRMESWDDFDRIGQAFGYTDADGLAEVNGLAGAEELDGGIDIALPDWTFLTAPPQVNLEEIDRIFDLPPGSTIPVGRVHHPDPRLPYAGETIAVPTRRMARRIHRRPSGGSKKGK
jgi:hypothetical protein